VCVRARLCVYIGYVYIYRCVCVCVRARLCVYIGYVYIYIYRVSQEERT